MATDNQLEKIIAGLKRHCNLDLSHSSRDSFLRDLQIALAQHDAAEDAEGDEMPPAEGVDGDDDTLRKAKAVIDAGLSQFSSDGDRPILSDAAAAKAFVDQQIARGVIGLRRSE